MKKILDRISEILMTAFEECGYDPAYGKATLSNRPDLCEYQCNGALAAAKKYRKAPILIAKEVTEKLAGHDTFSLAEAVPPGFINLKASPAFVSAYLQEMQQDPNLSMDLVEHPHTIIVDYGGANVAKPLHVGHLRSAIIGESVKRICAFMGNQVIGDVHLGDWGLQMGLIITEVKHRQPELPYFDPSYEGEYPQEAPFTISQLEEIYPTASSRSKVDEEYRAEAMEATVRLQSGDRGYNALWHHILNVSMADLKKNYDNLNVHFELWKKESDAQPYIADMARKMKEDGYAYEDQGALIVDISEESDAKELPPCMILKSDGGALYTTTDLATIIDRMLHYQPDEMIYLADKRQELHYIQFFRCAKKTHLVNPDTGLQFIGFGTMNGKDGKPFKTREGGVMRLEHLMNDINEEMYRKIMDNHEADPDEARQTARLVGLSALKYGDLSNQASKDYVFDVDRFTSFEGNSGPYILYTIVRIKSILNRYTSGQGGDTDNDSGVSVSTAPAASNTENSTAAEALTSINGTSNTEAAAPASPADPEASPAVGESLRQALLAARRPDIASGQILPAASDSEKNLQLELTRFNSAIESAYEEKAPHRICAYIYDLANVFNRFYHETRILAEEDARQKESWIELLELTRRVLETSIALLGFTAPEKM